MKIADGRQQGLAPAGRGLSSLVLLFAAPLTAAVLSHAWVRGFGGMKILKFPRPDNFQVHTRRTTEYGRKRTLRRTTPSDVDDE